MVAPRSAEVRARNDSAIAASRSAPQNRNTPGGAGPRANEPARREAARPANNARNLDTRRESIETRREAAAPAARRGPAGGPGPAVAERVRAALSGIRSKTVSPLGVTPKSPQLELMEKYNLRGTVDPVSPYGYNYRTAELLRATNPKIAERYGQTRLTEALNTFTRAMPSEADVGRYGTDALQDIGRVGLNQIVGGMKPETMLENMDSTRLSPRTKGKNLGYMVKAGSPMDTLSSVALADALMGRGVSRQALNASNFVAANTPMVGGVNKVGDPVNGTQFGEDPTWGNRIANANRSSIAALNGGTPATSVASLNKAQPSAQELMGGMIPTPRSKPATQTQLAGLVPTPRSKPATYLTKEQIFADWNNPAMYTGTEQPDVEELLGTARPSGPVRPSVASLIPTPRSKPATITPAVAPPNPQVAAAEPSGPGFMGFQLPKLTETPLYKEYTKANQLIEKVGPETAVWLGGLFGGMGGGRMPPRLGGDQTAGTKELPSQVAAAAPAAAQVPIWLQQMLSMETA